MAGMTPKAFDSWIAAGVSIVERPQGRGGDWLISPSQVIQWLWQGRAKPNGKAGPTDLSLDAERARLAKEQADGHELKNAALRGELLPAAEVVAGWQAAVGRARSLLLGIATAAPLALMMLANSREPQDAERAIREDLTRRIDAALAELGAGSGRYAGRQGHDVLLGDRLAARAADLAL